MNHQHMLPEHAPSNEVDAGDEDVFAGYILQRAGINFNYLFFPGLIVHEFAHYIACVLAGVPVYGVVWWSPRGGHVIHRRARGTNAVIISLAPFLINNILAIIFLFQGLADANAGNTLSSLAFFWLGFSLAVYAVPSAHDLNASIDSLHRAWRTDRKTQNVFARAIGLIVYPIWFLVQYALVYTLLPLSRMRTLRLLWAVALLFFVTSGAASTLIL